MEQWKGYLWELHLEIGIVKFSADIPLVAMNSPE
jgi:hypothetical protein